MSLAKPSQTFNVSKRSNKSQEKVENFIICEFNGWENSLLRESSDCFFSPAFPPHYGI